MSNNVLTYDGKRYYYENNLITNDSNLSILQLICYNEPKVIDEEFCHILRIVFIDTIVAKSNIIIDLETDTNIVKSYYSIGSVWNWGNEDNIITGKIEIIEWQKDLITLNENVIVNDNRRSRIITFNGTRRFTRK